MKKLFILIIAIVSMGSIGCKKYLDVNTNPSVPQVVKAELLLPPIIYQMTNGTAQDNRIIWKMTQNMVGTSTADGSLLYEKHGYVAASDVGGVIWRMTYVDLGLNLENMINDAVANQKYEYAGIGYAIKAWAYQMCTDLHGPIILDAAFDKNLLRFPYQDQPDVYAKVREWGNLSIKYLNMTSPVNYATTLAGVSGDYMYKGDKAKWKKFVYALFAQQYSHLRNKADFTTKYADSVIKYSDLSFIDESESATIGFTATSSNDSNPLGPAFGYLVPAGATSIYYGRPTSAIVNYLAGGVRGTPVVNPTSSTDPRLSKMIAPSTATGLTGVYIGAAPLQGSATTGLMTVYGAIPSGATTYNGRYIFANAARYPIMTYSQLQFAKSEALLAKGNSASALAAYRNGIQGHMDFYNRYGRASTTPDPAITAAEITAYMNSSEVAQTASALTISDIMGQKFIAQWGWAGMEQWCDLRKYHYDTNVFKQFAPLTAGDLFVSGKYAYRFRPRYNSEYVWNTEELSKWGALNPDYMTYETWFSQP